jgi:hypothetical protein
MSVVESEDEREDTLGPLLFNIFLNDLSARINHSKVLLFADDLKIYKDIKSAEDCKALQTYTDSVHQWCGENCTEINIKKLKLYLSHVRPTVSILITMSVMF